MNVRPAEDRVVVLPGGAGRRKHRIRVTGAVLALWFGAVALVLLVIPVQVVSALNWVGNGLGLPEAPLVDLGYFTAMAVAFMYVTSVLAVLVAREPHVKPYAIALVHAEGAAAVLSLALFAFQQPHFIYLASFAASGLVAVIVHRLCLREARPAQTQLSLVHGGRSAMGAGVTPLFARPRLTDTPSERRDD